ncbi:hypothetical protein H0H92_007063 [Tricholoma furcatifolium]|nr:hypothetical protein H0H92_007063 [Tricholoma furcatifolium]
MQFEKPDLWVLEGPTRSVTSFLSLSLDTSGRWSGIETRPVSTGQRGLGWSFVVQAVPLPLKYRNTPSICIKISVATHTIATGKIGTLSVSITSSGSESDSFKLAQVASHQNKIFLPAAMTIPLATYRYSPEASEIQPQAGVANKFVFEIRIELPPTFTLDPNDGYQQSLRSVLTNSLCGGVLGDMQFCLFTRRGGYDSVTGLDTVFANSTLLHGHSEPLDKPDKVLVEDLLRKPHYVPYDYSSDSDLEDDDDTDSTDFEEYYNEVDLWVPPYVSTVMSPPGDSGKTYASRDLNLKDGQSVIFIQDVAFQTWKTLVHYLQTGSGEIIFNALRSSPREGTLNKATGNSDDPPSCSPKSMYRLASKLESEKLMKTSLAALGHSLSKDNILEEVFSDFTSLYPEVQKIELDLLVSFLKEPAFVQELLGKMKTVIVDGKTPHCAMVVAAMMSRTIELANKEPQVVERPCETCKANAKAAEKEKEKLRVEAEEEKKKKQEEEQKPKPQWPPRR